MNNHNNIHAAAAAAVGSKLQRRRRRNKAAPRENLHLDPLSAAAGDTVWLSSSSSSSPMRFPSDRVPVFFSSYLDHHRKNNSVPMNSNHDTKSNNLSLRKGYRRRRRWSQEDRMTIMSSRSSSNSSSENDNHPNNTSNDRNDDDDDNDGGIHNTTNHTIMDHPLRGRRSPFIMPSATPSNEFKNSLNSSPSHYGENFPSFDYDDSSDATWMKQVPSSSFMEEERLSSLKAKIHMVDDDNSPIQRDRDTVISMAELSPVTTQRKFASTGNLLESPISPPNINNVNDRVLRSRPIAYRKRTHSSATGDTENIHQQNQNKLTTLNWLIFICGAFFGGLLSSLSLISLIHPASDVWHDHDADVYNSLLQLSFGTNQPTVEVSIQRNLVAVKMPFSRVFHPFLCYIISHRLSSSICVIYFMITMEWLWDHHQYKTNTSYSDKLVLIQPIFPPLQEILLGMTGIVWASAFCWGWNWVSPLWNYTDRTKPKTHIYAFILVFNLIVSSYLATIDTHQELAGYSHIVSNHLNSISQLYECLFSAVSLSFILLIDEGSRTQRAKYHLLISIGLMLGFLFGNFPHRTFFALTIFISLSVFGGPFLRDSQLLASPQKDSIRKLVLSFTAFFCCYYLKPIQEVQSDYQ